MLGVDARISSLTTRACLVGATLGMSTAGSPPRAREERTYATRRLSGGRRYLESTARPWRSWTKVLLTLSLGLGAPPPCSATQVSATTAFVGDRVRIVYPGDDLPRGFLRRLIDAFAESRTVDDLMPPGTGVGQVTMTLAASPSDPTVDGWSSPRSRIIVLPLSKAVSWSDLKLRRVLAHEYAHLALAALPIGPLGRGPVWFEEGFAEWASGPPTCEGTSRLRLEVAIREARSTPLPGLLGNDQPQTPRLRYDFYGSLFEYLEHSGPTAVRLDQLLPAARDHGAVRGIEIVTGVSLAQLEEDWHGYLSDRYGRQAPRLTCTPTG